MVKNKELIPLFDQLKDLLKPYEKSMLVLTDDPGRYELALDREIHTQSRKTGNIIKKDNVYLVGLIIQKSYVGFYFMPIYSHKDEFIDISNELMSLLKGKSCFYIKSLDQDLKKELKKVIKKGYQLYKEMPDLT